MEATVTAPARTAASPAGNAGADLAPSAALSAARDGLTSIAQSFDEYQLEDPARGILDIKVKASIDAFRDSLNEFRRHVAALADEEDDEQAVAPLLEFFARILPCKQVRCASPDTCTLWSDGYRFILRELFLTAVATLCQRSGFSKAARLIAHDFDAGGAGASFVAFDSYVRSLDEFRDRRLGLQSRSYCAELMRERADDTLCPFKRMMECDLALCLKSLLSDKCFFERWYPRTLVLLNADTAPVSGLFLAAAEDEHFEPLGQLLGLDQRAQLLEGFEAACERWQVDTWQLAGEHLNLRALLGLSPR